MAPSTTPTRPRVQSDGRAFLACIALVITVAACISAFASRRNSLTFDEAFLVAGGARGFATGDFSMAGDQAVGMLYVYGGAVDLYGRATGSGGASGIGMPSEAGTIQLPPNLAAQMPASLNAFGPVPRWGLYNRYDYAREFFFNSGNNPESLALAARLAAVLIAVALAICVAIFAWRRSGPLAALLSTAIFVFLPDVMAHGAIAYNDLPFALCFFLSLWAWDQFTRDPAAKRAVVAGVAIGAALCVKFSALSIGPAAIALCLVEAAVRGGDGLWMKRMARLTPLALATTLAVLVVVYRGDVTLTQFREGALEVLKHSDTGHGVPTLLLGHLSETAVWYFYPVALVLKTPVALHLLAVVALFGYASKWRWSREILSSPLRLLPIGALVYLAILMQSNINIGVRYALPVLPLLALLIGIGISRVWQMSRAPARVAIASLVILHAASTVSNYPWFLSYITEYVSRGTRRIAMVDSNLDWGQGLLALRDFMREERIDGVYLAYFGSASPEGYGIRYSPLPSWRPLPDQPDPVVPFKWVVISATHLEGLYEQGDPFAEFRGRTPDRTLGGSLFAYRLR